ncbi:MAG: ABC transporter ATP-binding protein [Myxococcota bacterium]
MIAAAPLVRVEGLSKSFPVTTGWLRRRIAHADVVREVSFSIAVGETFALVGESGSGKSTIARLLLRLLKQDRGAVFYRGTDLDGLTDRDLRAWRRHAQIVFQDPLASLNPRLSVHEALVAPMRLHGLASSEQDSERQAKELLSRVGLRDEYLGRYPHELSSGQRQRVSLARALTVRPEFLVADEILSALDANVQAQIVNLLIELKADLGLSYLFISHDLAMVRHLSDRVAVLYAGRIVEIGSTERVFSMPRHPYTEALLAAAPRVGLKTARRPRLIEGEPQRLLQGEPPSPLKLPSGCAFHPRCSLAQEVCRRETPALQRDEREVSAACHVRSSNPVED